jgi:hypothetical protein
MSRDQVLAELEADFARIVELRNLIVACRAAQPHLSGIPARLNRIRIRNIIEELRPLLGCVRLTLSVGIEEMARIEELAAAC